jgi:hypothetical protein
LQISLEIRDGLRAALQAEVGVHGIQEELGAHQDIDEGCLLGADGVLTTEVTHDVVSPVP